LGGDGIDLMEPLRADSALRRIFGLDPAPSDATTYRILCVLAGLEERAFARNLRPGRGDPRPTLATPDQP
jgi:hypothetical protein